MRETKAQKQERFLRAYIESTSSIPSYSNFVKYFEEGKTLFTESTFPRYYWKYKGVDATTLEGRAKVRYYKENIKEGNFDLSTIEMREDGVYVRKFGEKNKVLILSLGKTNNIPTLNKTVKDKKSRIEVCRDYNVSFNLPLNKKLHIMITKDQIHFRKADVYLKETFKSKRLFEIKQNL